MEINKLNDLVQFQLMTEVIKTTLGDSPTFQIVMESMMSAFEKGELNFTNTMNEVQTLGENISEQESIDVNNEKISKAIYGASSKYKVDADLIKAVIKQESNYNPYSVSKAGAMGLMQLMPKTAKALGVENPFDVEDNIDGGTKYLRDMLNMFSQTKQLALAAYNGGPGTMKKRGVDTIEEIEKMPAETRDYVKKVMKYYGK